MNLISKLSIVSRFFVHVAGSNLSIQCGNWPLDQDIISTIISTYYSYDKMSDQRVNWNTRQMHILKIQ